MRCLVISPDYASHASGLLEVAAAARDRGHQVVFATGEAVRPSVTAAGLEWQPLRLGRGHNAGTIRVEEQVVGEDAHLQEFFAATRRGPAAVLTYQALARQQDLLFEPDRVLDEISRIIDLVAPDRVVVDHIAFGATLALYALDIPYTSVVLGHPTALPVEGELYGLPPVWPDTVRPSDGELDELRTICENATTLFTESANTLLERRAPHRPSISDAFRRTGSATLFNYPEALHPAGRRLPDGATFLGSLARDRPVDDIAVLPRDRTRVFVSLGTFLGARDDVLRTAVAAARSANWVLALAHGSTPRSALGELPSDALVAASLPQVALLDQIDVVVTHGGNNTVTESVRAGVPMVVLPLSTDQFAGAASVETYGAGTVLDPNHLSAQDLVDAVAWASRSDPARRAQELGRRLRQFPGAELAVDAFE